jgi:hypothetical protein
VQVDNLRGTMQNARAAVKPAFTHTRSTASMGTAASSGVGETPMKRW